MPYFLIARLAAVVPRVAALRAAGLVTCLRAGAFALSAGFAFAGAILAFTDTDFVTAGFAFAGAVLAFTDTDFLTAGFAFAFAGAVLAFTDTDFLTAGFAFAGAVLAFTDTDFLTAGFAFAAGFRAGDLVAGMFGTSRGRIS